MTATDTDYTDPARVRALPHALRLGAKINEVPVTADVYLTGEGTHIAVLNEGDGDRVLWPSEDYAPTDVRTLGTALHGDPIRAPRLVYATTDDNTPVFLLERYDVDLRTWARPCILEYAPAPGTSARDDLPNPNGQVRIDAAETLPPPGEPSPLYRGMATALTAICMVLWWAVFLYTLLTPDPCFYGPGC